MVIAQPSRCAARCSRGCNASGIAAYGGDAFVDRTTVRDINAPQTIGEWGAGIRFYNNGEGATRPTGIVTSSTVDEAHRVGVELWAAEATLERVLVRRPRKKTDGQHGFGVIAFDHDVTLEPSDLTYRGGVIDGASQGGLVISGSHALVDAVAVTNTQPTATGALGVAVSVIANYQTAASASAEMSNIVVDGTHGGGIVVGGGDLVLSDAIVRNVDKQLNVDDFGDGIGASSTIVWIPTLFPTTLDVTRVTVEGVPRAGISNFGATVTVNDSLLECNPIDLDGENLDEAPFEFASGGDNDCGCAAERHECKVLTTNLEPPFAL